jgi:hypothetical protein
VPLNALSNHLDQGKLSALKDYLKNHYSQDFKCGNPELKYKIWYTPARDSINIQLHDEINDPYGKGEGDQKLGIKVENGKVTSLYVDNGPASALHTDRLAWIVKAMEIATPASPTNTATATASPTTAQPAPDVTTTATGTVTTPLPPVTDSAFSVSDLITFKAALEDAYNRGIGVDDPHEMLVGDKLYKVWYTPKFKSINIQEANNWAVSSQNEKLGVSIDHKDPINPTSPYEIKTVFVNGEDKTANRDEVLKDKLPLLLSGFKKVLEISSKYESAYAQTPQGGLKQVVQATVIKRGLNEVPEFHLSQLADNISNDPRKGLRVVFIKDDLSLDAGVDAGGLSRDYLDDVAEGIAQSKVVKFHTNFKSKLGMPVTQQESTKEQSIPSLTQEESAVFGNLGKLMMYCYLSAPSAGHWDYSLTLGHHYDETLFQAVLTLTEAEIDTPFEVLPLSTKLKLGKGILQRMTEEGMDMSDFIKMIDNFAKFDEIKSDDAKLKSFAQTLCYAELLPAPYSKEGPSIIDVPDMTYIKDHLGDFEKLVGNAIFGLSVGAQDADGKFATLGSHLAPIHAIAKGMKSLNPGDRPLFDNKVDFKQFNSKIQGEIKRDFDVQYLSVSVSAALSLGVLQSTAQAEIDKKVGWMKKWLKDSATTDEEVRQFFKWATGSSSLPVGKQIKVGPQLTNLSPCPASHSCAFQIDISPKGMGVIGGPNDRNEEDFIKCLKIAMTGKMDYGMD